MKTEQTNKQSIPIENAAIGPDEFRITAGGFDCVPFVMALGEYVTTNSPFLVEEPPVVFNRYFTGGQIPFMLTPLNIQISQPSVEEPSQELRQSELYYISHISELVDKYNGNFIAIMENRVLDSDISLDLLMTRVYNNYGYRPILMRRVTREVQRHNRMPTPRLARIP
jgi:hypothetical protein